MKVIFIAGPFRAPNAFGFRAHGNHKQMVTTRLRQLPLFQEERP
jgi:hypothetical protein